ncbi:hypothetical protein ANN_01122 [Periplaneta americana]|uniref:Uncharacterized protein n=1 Tax=Periplaneta americana TaxID=6978 RepID=A0ABQ8TV66_PERAM|nr:hypothetical protein ANN_01122 [Periplaneta americana]
MAGLCEGGNEPADSLKPFVTQYLAARKRSYRVRSEGLVRDEEPLVFPEGEEEEEKGTLNNLDVDTASGKFRAYHDSAKQSSWTHFCNNSSSTEHPTDKGATTLIQQTGLNLVIVGCDKTVTLSCSEDRHIILHSQKKGLWPPHLTTKGIEEEEEEEEGGGEQEEGEQENKRKIREQKENKETQG